MLEPLVDPAQTDFPVGDGRSSGCAGVLDGAPLRNLDRGAYEAPLPRRPGLAYSVAGRDCLKGHHLVVISRGADYPTEDRTGASVSCLSA
jgi:hypothetical protein